MEANQIKSEKDVEMKIVLKLITQLGYKENEWRSNYPIQVGRRVIFADFLISSNINDPDKGINLVIEAKKPEESLENYVKQAVSYGRLTKSKLSILINDTRLLIVDNENPSDYKEYKIDDNLSLISKGNYFTNKNKVSYGIRQLIHAEKEAKKFAAIEEFSSKFEKCQDEIRNIDGKTGSDAFDELSKLLFVKIFLEEKEDTKSIFSEESIKRLGVNIIKDHYFGLLIKKHPDLFKSDDKIDLKDETVLSIVKILQDYTLRDTDIDIKGRAYEILLGKTFLGSLGQHFTPRTVVNFMTDMLNPSSRLTKDYFPTIIDPACGSGGFLIKSLEEMLIKGDDLNFNDDEIDLIRKSTIFGSDLNERLVRVAKMNMSLHGDGKGGIYRCNGLEGNDKLNIRKYDYVLTNPPFGTKTKERHILGNYNLAPPNPPQKGINGEILFVERSINLLKNEGKIGILIPDGLINNKTTKKVRSFIMDKLEVDAIISLPDKTFKSANANAVTSIMFGTKRTKKVNKYIFMALAEEIGFERKTKNAKPISQNDLFAINSAYNQYLGNIADYNNRNENIIDLRTNPKIFLVSKEHAKEKRIDAPYYYSTYLHTKHIGGKFVRLSKYAKIIHRKMDFIDLEIPYIEFSSVLPGLGIISNHRDITQSTRPNRAKYVIKTNDILCARMRDSETNIAIVPEQYNDCLATNGFVILNPIPPMTVECLFYLLVSKNNINQVRWKANGTIMPTVDDKEYLNNWVPDLDETQINSITSKIKPRYKEMFKVIEKLSIELQQDLI